MKTKNIMQVIVAIVSCIAVAVGITTIIKIVSDYQEAHAEIMSDERKTIPELIADELARDGKIWTYTEFFGGDTKEDIKGYIFTVYDDLTAVTYCVYVEIETISKDEKYDKSEIEIDADEIKKEIIF